MSWNHRLAASGAVSLVFATSLVAGVVTHFDLAPARRLAARGLTSLFAPLFEGRLLVETIEHVGWNSADVGWVRVYDPKGHRIINVHGLHADVFLPSLLVAIVADGPLVIHLPRVHVDEAEVIIDLEAEDHTVGIANTFVPPSAPLPPGLPEPRPLARVIRVELPDIFLVHGSVVGNDELGFPLDAEASNVAASLVAGSEGAQLDVQTFRLFTRAPAPLYPAGWAEYHLRVPHPKEGPPPYMWATLRGAARDVGFVANARLEGPHLTGDVEVAEATPAQLHTLVPGFPLQEEKISLQGSVDGDLPNLEVQARLVAGPGEVRFDGDLHVASPLVIDGDFRLTDVDPSSFVANLGPASVSASGQVQVAFPNQTVVIAGRAKTEATSLAGVFVPEMALVAGYDATGLHGSALVYEPGATGDVAFSTDPALRQVQLDADLHADDLDDVLRLNHVARGRGDVHVGGAIDSLGLHLSVQSTLDDVDVAHAVRLHTARIVGHVSGPLRDPDVTATLEGEDNKLGDLTVQRLHLTAAGPLLQPHLELTLDDERWKQLALQADLNVTESARLTNLRLAFHESELEAEAKVASVSLQGGAVALQGIRIDSSGGAVEGDVVLRQQGVDADIAGTVDLARLSQLVPALTFTGGTAAFSAHVHRQAKGHDGHVAVRVENAEIQGVLLRTTVGLDTFFQGTQARATYGGRLTSPAGPELLSLQGTAEGRIEGSFFEPNTWRHATGQIDLHDVTVDLNALYESEFGRPLLTQALRLANARGHVHAAWAAEKKDPLDRTTHHVAVQTKGLALTWHGDNASSSGVALEGVDGSAGLSLRTADGAPTQTNLEFGGFLHDEHGTLARANAHLQIDLASFFNDAKTLVTGTGGDGLAAAERFTSLPFTAELVLPERPLATWPAVVRARDLDGSFGGAVLVSGTLNDPEAKFAMRAHNVSFRAAGSVPWPVDGSVSGHLGRQRMEAWGRLLHDHTEVAEVTVNSDSGLARMLASESDGPPWKLGGLLVLRGFQLEALPQLTPYGVSGRVSGTVSAASLHDHPELVADLSLLRGTAMGREFPSASLRGHLGGNDPSFLTLLLRQGGDVSHPQGGSLELSALPSLVFPDRWWPALDPQQTQTLTVRAQSMHLSPVAPLIESVVSELGGYLTGELTVRLPAHPEATPLPAPEVEGSFLWRDGTFVIPQFGQTLSKGHFNLDVSTDEKDVVVRLTNFQVAAKTGHVDGSFDVRLPGSHVHRWVFGPGPSDGEPPDITGTGDLRIAEANKIPLTFQGIPVGEAYGKVLGTIRANPRGIDVHLEVPTFTLELPKTQSSSAQDLGEADDIGVVDQKNRAGNGRRERREPALPLRLDVVLGTDEDRRKRKAQWQPHFFVRRAGIDVGLRGQAQLVIAKDIKMTAEIEAVQGRVTVLGKPFLVDHGVVRAEQDDPANPFVEFSAYWDSPAGTRVYVEASDRFKTLKPFFRSDPPRPEASVLSLVLFGRDTSTDANVVAGTQSTAANGASSAALGGASSVLNNLLDPVQVFGRRLETRVDTSSSRDARIGVATEIRPNLWAQIDVSTTSRQLRQNADASSLTLDWRFRRNWSLRTSVGNLGSSNMDLLWQYRY